MEFESPAVRRNREERRARFSAWVSEELKRLEAAGPSERLEEYRSVRGRFFFEPEERQTRLRMINEAVPGRKEEILAAADRLLAHEFDILGSGPVCLGERIDWQRDFKSGIAWRKDVIYPAWNWRQVDDLAGVEIYRGHFYDLDDPSDLKMPWDLSSFFHLATLGEAYLQTGDERYRREVEGELRDWHAENVYPRGVNWTCAMVAGIRLANMLFALHQIDAEEFWGEVGLLSILQHLKFILDFLEVDQDGRRNNHYLNNLVGLGFGATEIARSRLGAELLDFTAEELARETRTQFSPDGTNYEGTIPYHRFAAESLIVTAILLECNGRGLGCRDELERIVRFIDVYTKPNGLAQQIGDNDNGRILVLHDYGRQEYRDHRHILAVGAAWLGLEGIRTGLEAQTPDVAWLLGKPAPAAAPPMVRSGFWNDNGYGVFKSGGTSLFVRCGCINGMSGGGHNHCDQLSFEFQDLEQDLVVDPGAYIYSADSPARNYFRSTAAHNTLQLDDLEQQEFNARDLFAMRERAGASLTVWEFDGERLRFQGRHSAFPGWQVVREMEWDGQVLSVRDRVVQTGEKAERREFCGRLHLAAGIALDEELILRSGGRCWRLRFPASVSVRAVPGRVSPGYGVALPATVLEYRFSASHGAEAGFTLERTTKSGAAS